MAQAQANKERKQSNDQSGTKKISIILIFISKIINQSRD